MRNTIYTRRFFGPGLLLIVAVIGYLYMKNEPVKRTELVMRADSEGKMQPVEVPTPTASASHTPLWKPEPSLLLDRRLGLSDSQRVKIERIDGQWTVYRDSARRQFLSIQKDAESGPSSLSQISDRLQTYSGLSREYDATRVRLWDQALALLNREQQSQVDRLRQEVAP